jgi:hypothetical protein
MNATAQNAGIEYANGPQAQTIFSFQIDAPSAIEAWRVATMGSAANSGNTADAADFDGDGKSNLEEFAFGTEPGSNGSGTQPLVYNGTFAGGGTTVTPGQPITLFESITAGVDFRAIYTRRKDYVAAGLTYTPQFSADMTNWVNGTVPGTVLSDNGVLQTVSVPYPAFIGGKKARFFRIQISIAP